MLKTPDGNISGSLKVVQGHKKGGDWTWKEQVQWEAFVYNSNIKTLLTLTSSHNNDNNTYIKF